MQPLIDADVLVYEIGFAAETGWKAVKEWKEGDAPLDPPPFEYVAELLDNRIAEICGCVMATSPPLLFLTGKDNFREKIATTLPYKGNRDGLKKPWHYDNIKAYMMTKYNTLVIEGMEADDAMCITQLDCDKHHDPHTSLVSYWDGVKQDGKVVLKPQQSTIICTRDKDLRQCPGWHFGWELGNQPQFGPEFVNGFGYIKLSEDNKKLSGVGDKFFYAQILMGDRVDNIPGLPRCGPKNAFKILEATTTKEEAEKAVVEAYKAHYGDVWKERMLEQAQLVWMVKELNEEGKPVMWNFTYEV